MSIIEEALRRAERGAAPAVAAAPLKVLTSVVARAPIFAASTPAHPQQAQTSHHEARRWPTWIAACAVVVIVGMGWIRYAGGREMTTALLPPPPRPVDIARGGLPPTGMEQPVTIAESLAASPFIPTPMRLSGVLTQSGAPLAIVNDEVVRIGDTVGGATVVDITDDGVVLERNDKRLTLIFPR